MFNFAHRSESSDGQFNGRFAFRARHNSHRVSPEELKAIANAAPDALADDAIRHEFLHWKVFRSSRVGRALVGKRYRTRVQFLRGNYKAAQTYYLQRSAYFCESYAVHEELVRKMEEQLGDQPSMKTIVELTLSKEDERLVFQADANALALCAEHGSPYSSLEQRLDSLLGKVATREFGIQAYVDLGQDRLVLNEVSLKGLTHGIFNSATETAYSNAPRYIRAIRKIVQYGNAERWFGQLTPDLLARWAYIKLNTELSLVKTPRIATALQAAHGSLERYIRDNVNFIVTYTGAKYDALAKALIVELLLECGRQREPDEEVLGRLAALNGEFLYFFYAHGN